MYFNINTLPSTVVIPHPHTSQPVTQETERTSPAAVNKISFQNDPPMSAFCFAKPAGNTASLAHSNG